MGGWGFPCLELCRSWQGAHIASTAPLPVTTAERRRAEARSSTQHDAGGIARKFGLGGPRPLYARSSGNGQRRACRHEPEAALGHGVRISGTLQSHNNATSKPDEKPARARQRFPRQHATCKRSSPQQLWQGGGTRTCRVRRHLKAGPSMSYGHSSVRLRPWRPLAAQRSWTASLGRSWVSQGPVPNCCAAVTLRSRRLATSLKTASKSFRAMGLLP